MRVLEDFKNNEFDPKELVEAHIACGSNTCATRG